MYFSKCCGCIPLKKGLTINGILGVLASLSGLNFKKNCEAIKYMERIDFEQKRIAHKVLDQDGVDEFASVACYVVPILAIVQLIFSFILLIAVSKERENMMKSYYVYSIVRSVVLAIVCVCVGIYYPSEYLLPLSIISFLFEVYVTLVVRSMLHEIHQKHTLQLTNNQVAYSPTVAQPTFQPGVEPDTEDQRRG